MRLLLDTHTLLWFISNDPQLSSDAKGQIEHLDNIKYVSVVSLWEIAVKVSINKLTLPKPFEESFPQQLEENGFELLPVAFPHLYKILTLPFHHRDPFDRLLVAQAMVENMTLVTRDTNIPKYPVNTLW